MNKIFFIKSSVLSIILICFLAFLCKEQQRHLNLKPCSQLNKVDSVFQEVFNKRYMYSWISGLDSINGYVLLNEHISKGKKFNGVFFDNIIAISQNELDSVDGYVSFSLIKFNSDTSTATIKANYVLLKRVSRTNQFKFSFDTINCKWTLFDSTVIMN